MDHHLPRREPSGALPEHAPRRSMPAVRASANTDGSTGQQLRRVLFYTAPEAMQEPGGGEVQLLKTAEYLGKLGVEARLLDPWKDRFEPGDWLHLCGTVPKCLSMARLAQRYHIPVALSTVSWYDPWTDWHVESHWRRRLRGVASWSARRLFPRFPSWRRQLIQAADLLLPNSRAEAAQLTGLLGADPQRTIVVPNGVDARFQFANPDMFQSRFRVQDFVLVPGRIEPRKNQLAVIRAIWGLGIPLIILGNPHPNHADYYETCRREADPAVTFVPRIDHDDPMLASAYAAARVVVLPSWFETPGLAALEGALAGTQIVVTELGPTREYFGSLANYIRPGDLAGLREQLRSAMTMPRQNALCELVRANYLWDEVARQTLAAYRRQRPGAPAETDYPLPSAA